MFSRGTFIKGPFISHVSACLWFTLFIILEYVAELLSGNGINFALINKQLLISTEPEVSRATVCFIGRRTFEV